MKEKKWTLTHLVHEERERHEHLHLERVREPVAQHANQGPGDGHDGRLERVGRREANDLAHPGRGLLLLVRGAVQDGLAQDGEDRGHALGDIAQDKSQSKNVSDTPAVVDCGNRLYPPSFLINVRRESE